MAEPGGFGLRPSDSAAQAMVPVVGSTGQTSGRRVQEMQSEIARVQTGMLRFPPPKPPTASSRLESSRERRVSRFSFNLAGFLFFTIHLFLLKRDCQIVGKPPGSGRRRFYSPLRRKVEFWMKGRRIRQSKIPR